MNRKVKRKKKKLLPEKKTGAREPGKEIWQCSISASLQVEGFQGNKCYFTGALYWI
jgi:hypothetical protein